MLLLFILLYFQNRTTFASVLVETENWLYDEGDDQNKNVYISKLESLKVCEVLIKLVSIIPTIMEICNPVYTTLTVSHMYANYVACCTSTWKGAGSILTPRKVWKYECNNGL